MAFTVSDLNDYIIEDPTKIYTTLLFGGKTIGMIGQQPGIKVSESILDMETTADFQADGGCSYATSGTTTFSDRIITVTPIMVSETLCPKDLEAKILAKLLKAGAVQEEIPSQLAREIIDRKVAKIQRQLEIAVWQGDTNSGLVNTKRFDGFLKLIDAASASTTNLTQQASISSTTIIGIMDNMYSATSPTILNDPDFRVFMGEDTFRILVLKLRDLNLYHYERTDDGKMEMIYPGTNMRVVALPGLNADNNSAALTAYKNRIIGTLTRNLVFGTDLANDFEQFKSWWSDDDQNVKMLCKFKAGVQIIFPSQISQYKNT